MIGTGSSSALRSLLFAAATPPDPGTVAFARSLRAQWLYLLRSAQWLAPRRPQVLLIGAAEGELLGIVRREFARLLRHAALVRRAPSRERAAEALRLDVLRCALDDELSFAVQCGRPPHAAFARLIDACLRTEPDAWPDAHVLALAAVALEDCARGRRTFLEAVALRDARCAGSLDLDRLFARPARRAPALPQSGANA